MSKGTLVLIPFPFTDLSGQKVRPALVLVDFKKGEDCIVAFISSVKQKRSDPFDIPLPITNKNGLKMDSIIKIGKIATLQKKIILGEIGVLESELLDQVDKKLKMLFSL